jgi:AcrR family transcriptional regulator
MARETPPGRDSTRERVLGVAAELFAARGYHGTGVQELCEAVSLGRGALYHHIRSKEELLVEIIVRPLEEVAEQSEKIAADAGDPEDKLRAMSRCLMRSIADHRPQWTVFLREFSSLSSANQRVVLSLRARYLALWERVIDEGIRAGVFPDSNLFFVNGLLGLYVYAHIWSAPQQSTSVDTAAHALSEFVLRGLHGERS